MCAKQKKISIYLIFSFKQPTNRIGFKGATSTIWSKVPAVFQMISWFFLN